MKTLVAILTIFLATACCNPGQAAEAEDKPHYTIGIKPSGPFAQNVENEWKGLSVDLINMLSERIGFTYEFVPVETITALLALPEMRTTDLSIGAISLSDEREKVIDFSHPYFTTTQGILTRESNGVVWFIVGKVVGALAFLIVVFYISGVIIHFFEKKKDIDTVHKGAWWTLVTFTTTGYGKYVPQTRGGMLFASFIMLASTFALSGWTAYVASAITVKGLTENVVTLADLTSKNTKVVAVGGSTTSSLLKRLEIYHNTVASPEVGAAMVKKGQATAFVYDKAILDYLLLKEDNASLSVSPLNRGLERYGIAFQPDSELREQFNVAILNIVNSPEWAQLNAQYFGN